MSLIAVVADAVVAALNSQVFDPTFTATRLYVPRYTLKQLETVQVAIVAAGIATTMDTRGTNQNDITIQVGVQKKMSGESESDIDPLLALAEDIASYLTRLHLVGGGSEQINWIKTDHSPIYSSQQIDEKKVFTSIITVTYRVFTGA